MNSAPKPPAKTAKRGPRKSPTPRKSPVTAKAQRSRELELKICQLLSEGKTIVAIADLPGMPSETRIRTWAYELHNPLADAYARAREIGYSRLVDEILEISDNISRDLIENPDGSFRVDHEHINRSRLRVDTRKWILAKMLPKVYGERSELVGRDGGPLEIKFLPGDENL